mmetsp:Transcript_1462/g.3069  ORF Transcript_1462/g.3069 Transcript_1462/m.3069 type:complete len:83 (+) Transcript_1462:1412-1660(+)
MRRSPTMERRPLHKLAESVGVEPAGGGARKIGLVGLQVAEQLVGRQALGSLYLWREVERTGAPYKQEAECRPMVTPPTAKNT